MKVEEDADGNLSLGVQHPHPPFNPHILSPCALNADLPQSSLLVNNRVAELMASTRCTHCGHGEYDCEWKKSTTTNTRFQFTCRHCSRVRLWSTQGETDDLDDTLLVGMGLLAYHPPN